MLNFIRLFPFPLLFLQSSSSTFAASVMVQKFTPDNQNVHRHTDKSLLYIRTSGAGSRASAEQFVGGYNYVGFILVLVGTQLE